MIRPSGLPGRRSLAPMSEIMTTAQKVNSGPEQQRTPLGRVLCRVGVHEGRWSYEAEGDCFQRRECGRCGSAQERTRHQLEWRYKRDGACDGVRSCERCDAVEVRSERTRHQWDKTYDIPTRW